MIFNLLYSFQKYEIEFAGYQKLFQQFLQGGGPAPMQWEKIEPLPAEAVSKVMFKNCNLMGKVNY